VTTLKLGTRRSLLAWAQSGWVARRIEALNPGVRVELVGIETQGDRIQDVPLRNVQGKEFFVAELDHALAAGRSDFSVHSMKDLSLDRPAGFVLAAIPRRENPRDVILFGPGTEAKLRAGMPLRIGTSSPRRLENIPAFLAQALPRFKSEPQIQLVEIRGNVNTRLGRVHEQGERALDGVVLAFAGLIRLWADEAGRAELAKLLGGVRWMVLPLRENPTAPAQGALAVECRADDEKTRAILAKLHDAASAREVASERQILADWGGGCHQRFGATRAGESLYIRGAKPDGSFVEETRWAAPPAPTAKGPFWNGVEHRRGGAESTTGARPDVSGRAVFAAHSRAWETSAHAGARVWTSGTPSWFRLAGQGIWVEGCAEGLGFEALAPTLAEGVLQLPKGGDWIILTHDQAREDWTGQVVATYRIERATDQPGLEELRAARFIYWSSASQWEACHARAAPGAHHACGPGKTAAHLRARGVNPVVFPSNEEWVRWTRS
jgi:hydroxymethylbilane synthase